MSRDPYDPMEVIAEAVSDMAEVLRTLTDRLAPAREALATEPEPEPEVRLAVRRVCQTCKGSGEGPCFDGTCCQCGGSGTNRWVVTDTPGPTRPWLHLDEAEQIACGQVVHWGDRHRSLDALAAAAHPPVEESP